MRPAVDEHVALVVEVDLAADELRARVVADRDEQSGRVDLPCLAGLGVAQHDALELVVADDLVDLAVPGELDLVVGKAPASAMILLARSSSRRWTSVTFEANLAQEGGLLDGGVAAAHDRDVLVAEEEAVTGGTPADAVAGQRVLVGQCRACGSRSPSPG